MYSKYSCINDDDKNSYNNVYTRNDHDENDDVNADDDNDINYDGNKGYSNVNVSNEEITSMMIIGNSYNVFDFILIDHQGLLITLSNDLCTLLIKYEYDGKKKIILFWVFDLEYIIVLIVCTNF